MDNWRIISANLKQVVREEKGRTNRMMYEKFKSEAK